MKIPMEDAIGLLITFCVILAGAALRCASFLPLAV